MGQHPSLLTLMGEDRAAELRRSATATPHVGRDKSRRNERVSGALRRTGWLLIAVGLRLALFSDRLSRRRTLASG
jgi:hypothetical protein